MSGLIYAGVAASAGTVIILLLRKFFFKSFFSKTFVLLWMLIILRLLVPCEFSSAISIYPSAPERPAFSAEYNVQIQGETESKTKTHAVSVPKPKDATKAFSFSGFVFAVWIFGAVSSSLFFAVKHFHTVKKVKKNCVLMESFPEGFEPEKTKFFKSKKLASPLSFGFLRPTVIVPENITDEQLLFVLLHEQTHIKNRDAVLKILAAGAFSLHWFNPFVHAAVKYLDRDIERRCDEKVLSIIGLEKASRYAGTILDFAEKENLSASLSFFSAAPLEERVISIMKNKNRKPRFSAVAAVFGAVILTMTACGTSPKELPQQSPVPVNIHELIEKVTENDSGSFVAVDTETGDMVAVSGSPSEEKDKYKEELAEAEKELAEIEDELSDAVTSGFVLVRPCESVVITAEFGGYSGHTGIDIYCTEGSPVFAMSDGIVEIAEKDTSRGYYVIIDHGNGLKTLYSQCSKLLAEAGTEVSAGETIALSGSSGNSTGPHLHFEIIEGENPVDPKNHLSFDD